MEEIICPVSGDKIKDPSSRCVSCAEEFTGVKKEGIIGNNPEADKALMKSLGELAKKLKGERR